MQIYYKEEYVKAFSDDIANYSVGIFPFYQNASIKTKQEYLQLIKNYYIPMEIDLIPLLPGLLLALLPSLIESN